MQHALILSIAPLFFFLLRRRPLISTLFPYTTLFRSRLQHRRIRQEPFGRPHCILADGTWLPGVLGLSLPDRKSTRLNSSHTVTSYAVFCLKKKRRIANLDSINQDISNKHYITITTKK